MKIKIKHGDIEIEYEDSQLTGIDQHLIVIKLIVQMTQAIRDIK